MFRVERGLARQPEVMPDDPKDDADCNQQNQIVSDEGTYCGAMKDGQRDTSGRLDLLMKSADTHRHTEDYPLVN